MEIAFISTSSSSVTPQCLTSSSRNPKFPMSSARAICNYQKVHPCSVVHTVAFLNNDSSRCTVVSKCSPEISEMNALLSKEKSSNKLLSPFGALATSTMENVIAAPLIGDEKIGVLLLNLGGPETLEDVQPFLFNLFADPDIIRLPRFFRFLQKPLAQFISVLRAPKSREGYSAIGGGSPLRKITDAQAEELRKSLCSKDVPAKVYVGMRYWHPFTEEAIEQVPSPLFFCLKYSLQTNF